MIPVDSAVETVILKGGRFVAKGSGVGPIRAANGGKLVFEDMTIVDESVSYDENAWELRYLEFEGDVEFINCVFENGILFNGDTASFTGCEFKSNTPSEYNVWISNGEVSFYDCIFTGTRGIKIHEAYGSEIDSVEVALCAFGPLTEKPGVAIGTLNADTSITIKNSTFTDCQSGEQGKYIYESDTPLQNFNFYESGNTIIN